MTRLRPLSDPDHLPALDTRFALRRPGLGLGPNDHPPRILLLYGSLRERSYSRLAPRRPRGFCAASVPISGSSTPRPAASRPGAERRPSRRSPSCASLALWSEGMVWCTPSATAR